MTRMAGSTRPSPIPPTSRFWGSLSENGAVMAAASANTRTAIFSPLPTSAALMLLAGQPVFAQDNPREGAQDTIKIGFSAPITGPFAENGRQMTAALKLYAQEHGTEVVGRKIEVLLRDDASVPDQAKRIAQEFLVNSKVAILA